MPASGNHIRAPRGDATGWSKGASRRNVTWLRSVDRHRLHELGVGFAVTLTLREPPASAAAFHRLRGAWLKRVQRMGLTAHHWVVESQSRRVPHLHATVFLPWSDEIVVVQQRSTDWWDEGRIVGVPAHGQSVALVNHWLDIAEPFGVSRAAQHVRLITEISGWMQYVAKHVSRSEHHYQRAAESIPEGWKKPGRVWGHGGAWPMVDPDRVCPDYPGFWAWRRLLRSLRVARRVSDLRRVESLPLAARRDDHEKSVQLLRKAVRSARRSLRQRPAWNQPGVPLTAKQLRGYSRRAGISEWHTKAQADVMVTHLAARGFDMYRPVEAPSGTVPDPHDDRESLADLIRPRGPAARSAAREEEEERVSSDDDERGSGATRSASTDCL